MNPDASEFVPTWLKPSNPQRETSSEGVDARSEYYSSNDASAADVVADNDHGATPVEVEEQVDAVADRIGEQVKLSSSKNHLDSATTNQTQADGTDEDNASEGDYDGPEDGEADEGEHDANVADSLSEATDGRKTINLVFIGHVDAGKSTISGHILYVTGEVDARTMEKHEREAKACGRETWKYAWALDLNPQERAKGKTEEIGRASFTTETRRFIILDAPGHKSFVPHMIGGASQADVGILVISARKGEFETGFERGGQTREHAMLAKTSGVRQLVVVINKMDDPTVILQNGQWSKDRYEECKTKLLPFLKGVGWKVGDITWLPLSGLTGKNLKDKVDPALCPWWDGESLLDTLDHLQPPERLLHDPVRLVVTEKYKDMGTVVMGKLETGIIRVNDKLVIMPVNVEVVVEWIGLEGRDVLAVEPGDNVRIRLRGIEEEDIRSGHVLCPPSSLVHAVRSFNAKLMILEHKSIITAGYSAVLHIHSSVEEFVLEKLLAELDKKGEVARKNIPFAKPGMTVVARIRICGPPICLEPFKESPQLGRFMVRAEGTTIAVGVVLKLIDVD